MRNMGADPGPHLGFESSPTCSNDEIFMPLFGGGQEAEIESESIQKCSPQRLKKTLCGLIKTAKTHVLPHIFD